LAVLKEIGGTRMPLEDEIIAPGQSIDALLQILSKREGGPFQHKLEFETNDPRNPLVTVTICGEICVPVYSEPHQLVIGHLRPGETVSRVIRMFDTRPCDDDDKLAMWGQSPKLQVQKIQRVIEDATRPARRIYDVHLAITAPTDSTVINETLKVSDSHGSEFYSMPVTGVCRAAVSVCPSSVLLSRTKSATNKATGRCICQTEKQDDRLSVSVIKIPDGMKASVTGTSLPNRKLIEITYACNAPFTQRVTKLLLAARRPGLPPETLELTVMIPDVH
jgi:hypothetical protein